MKRVALTNYILAMNQLLNLEEIGNAPYNSSFAIFAIFSFAVSACPLEQAGVKYFETNAKPEFIVFTIPKYPLIVCKTHN
jgi:hypothetical protein